MPQKISGTWSGDAAEFRRSLTSEPWLILAAVVVIYIVLGVLYESWIHPVTIISTLPSAGIGALLALMICGIDLSLVALVGIVLLMGIVKKNAIMMVDFAQDAQTNGGASPEEAIRDACLLRFRPIMMTTMAALLGALPLALGHGAGSELRYPLGVTIIGGLLLSQFLTCTRPRRFIWRSNGLVSFGSDRARQRRAPWATPDHDQEGAPAHAFQNHAPGLARPPTTCVPNSQKSWVAGLARHDTKRGARLSLRSGASSDGIFRNLHRPPGGDDAAGDRVVAVRRDRLPLPAGRRATVGGHSNHRRLRQPAADPETMANSIAAPLERRLGEIPGVTELTSTSSVGFSSIVIQFDLARDIHSAASDVMAAINAATADLPSDLPIRPYYRKFNPAEAPIMTLALSSATLSAARIYDAADTILAQRLSRADGVAQVTISGAEKPAIRVRLDPIRLAAAGLAGQDVYNAIRGTNVLAPTGGFQGPDTAETIGLNGQISQAEELAPLIVRTSNAGTVRLQDVASVINGTANRRLLPRGTAPSRRCC